MRGRQNMTATWNFMASSPAPSRPEPGSATGRLVTLDVMRGVAAVFVCLSHFNELAGGWYPRFAYLAVDLFFILSGFVIARAYDERLRTSMTFGDFFWRRLTRLLPILIIGAFLGALTPSTDGLGWRETSFLMNGVALPSLPPHRGGSLMPSNPPLWSLFYELWVANLAYGLFHRFLRPPVLGALVIVGAIGMVWTIHSGGWLNVGYGWSLHQIGYGLSRVLWGFFVGVALARLSRLHKPNAVPAIAVLAGVVACLCLPLNGGRVVNVVELSMVLIALPALVWFGSTTKEKNAAWGIMLGEASYALYATHYPVLRFAQPLLSNLGFTALPFALQVCIEVAVSALFVGAAWILADRIDEPAQRALRTLKLPALTSRLASRSSRAPG